MSLSNISRYQANSCKLDLADVAVKHILPLLSGILAAPFATAYPALLQASVKAIQGIIVAAWPRIARHRGEILKSITICWCRLDDEKAQSEELKAVQISIEQTVQLLTCAVTQDFDLVEECQSLIDVDGRLRDLLAIRNTKFNPL